MNRKVSDIHRVFESMTDSEKIDFNIALVAILEVRIGNDAACDILDKSAVFGMNGI